MLGVHIVFLVTMQVQSNSFLTEHSKQIVTHRVNPVVALITVFTTGVLIPTLNASADESLYLKTIKPLLKARCYACHGGLKQESDLRLDTAESILEAGIIDSGALLQRRTQSSPRFVELMGDKGPGRP